MSVIFNNGTLCRFSLLLLYNLPLNEYDELSWLTVSLRNVDVLPFGAIKNSASVNFWYRSFGEHTQMFLVHMCTPRSRLLIGFLGQATLFSVEVLPVFHQIFPRYIIFMLFHVVEQKSLFGTVSDRQSNNSFIYERLLPPNSLMIEELTNQCFGGNFTYVVTSSPGDGSCIHFIAAFLSCKCCPSFPHWWALQSDMEQSDEDDFFVYSLQSRDSSPFFIIQQ